MKNKKKETNAMKRCARKLTAGLLAGAMVLSTPVIAEAGSWRHNTRGWWWYNDDWSYPTNSWKTIYGKDYHFNSQGYMDTYWARVDGNYYWFGRANDGAKKTYWQNIWGKWYWLGSDGAMRTGLQTVWGKTYYLGGSGDGAMKTGWQEVPYSGNNPKNVTYTAYFGSDGVMRTGWQTIDGKKYYFEPDKDAKDYGGMYVRYSNIDGTEYCFAQDGYLLTYWQKGEGDKYYRFYGSDGIRRLYWQNIWGKTYYFGDWGDMATGWQEIDGDWYYFGGENDGSLKTNTWIGKYWVGEDGKWDKSKHNHEWVEKGGTIEHPEEGHYENVLVSPEEGHYETIHHEAEGYYDNVVHPEEYHFEKLPKDAKDYDDNRWFCDICGADMGVYPDEIDAHVVYHINLGDPEESITSTYFPAKKVVDKEEWIEENVYIYKEAWDEDVYVVDKEAEYESQWVVDKEAYTEVATETVCSICGIAKDK